MDHYIDKAVSDRIVRVEEIVQREAHIGDGSGANGALESSRNQFIALQRADAEVAVFSDIVLIIEHIRPGEGAVVEENYAYGGSGDNQKIE